ncbi:MAG: type II toxin-antitoxin system VapC family toxin [Candidatus Korarchaeota archaeon]|nr:type II toxin-antitoxin system VapC family toxin [Candidatus Korarchaeota archaeon]NIU83116.1 PIN domain-containing protein [Candidatus Thorarchaeota archaeon]NIW13493.1 PIN domain-containing protein [Candidatus Thorarchaeota archaeon]NIW51590.1 PIN domain-containing protein [Candidatus Korarchaeota archaeon]
MIFIDTSWFYAVEVEQDKYHEEAVKTKRNLAKGEYGIPYTSNYVIDETITLLRFKASLKAALAFKKKVETSQVLHVIRISKHLEEKANENLKKYRELPLSFTDCASIGVMEDLTIQKILGFDEDFRKAGYIVYPQL